jgi:hypothetical protein
VTDGRSRRLAAVALLVASAGCTRQGSTPPTATSYQPPDLTRRSIAQFQVPVYGASGVTQLPDGRILVAEDEERHPFDVIDLFGSGAAHDYTERETARLVAGAGVKGLNDLEALTIDPRGYVYASTSHALTSKGASKPERELLVRFKMSGDRIEDFRLSDGLKRALAGLDPVFVGAGDALPDEKKGLNIEGLAWDPQTKRLLVGFRNPRHKKKALAVWLDNPDAVFEHSAAPALEGPIKLDLDGDGVRDLTYSPSLSGFLILAGAWKHDQRTKPTLWLWKGSTLTAPVRLPTDALADLKPEGIAEVTSGGKRGLLIVSDDGSADEEYDRQRSLEDHGVSSRYLVLPFGEVVPRPRGTPIR